MPSTDARTPHRSVTLALTPTVTVDTNISKHEYDRVHEREYKHTIRRINLFLVQELCDAMPSIPTTLISPNYIPFHCMAFSLCADIPHVQVPVQQHQLLPRCRVRYVLS
jgi:hypothetical protein